MKLQSILLLTGIAAGLMTVSCKSTADEAEEFFGRPAPNKARAEAQDAADTDDYYNRVNAHIDRRLNEFNEKEESKLPIFSSNEVKEEFMELSFIKSAEQISLLSIDFVGPKDQKYNFLVDRESRTLARTIGDKTETFTFETFTNGVPPSIPFDAHILYAFATNFNRIAETVTLRCYEKLERGENPAIADLHNESNIDEKGKKKDKNFVEVKPKITSEPLEFRIDNRGCKCYDVTLKKICAPAVSMSLFVSNEERTISRVDITLDDDSRISYIMDWREQDGIVLPRVVRRINDNAVFFREDAKVILKSARIAAEAEEAAAAAEAAADETDDDASADAGEEEEEMVEIDLSRTNTETEEESSDEEDIPMEDDDFGED